ncbi:MAG: hypothetical protein KJ578_06425 [Bacteroidetes bacterium]|nr:hypothetical protein [Bacteroidota bacterium]MBU1580461.1 hypothetical protein [Bacteroidota bacterium]MBU2557397.1 hypothetical protein [Bacteroidota bacterium]
MRKFILLASVFLLLSPARSQENVQQLSPDDIDSYKQQCRQMVNFIEGTLNFLGDTLSTVQEKEIVINESFSKIFRDDEVQVEDDLDENREMPVNKNVQAYLKDVDFFFKTVRFTFDIRKIDPLMSEDGSLFFKVMLIRKLDGITVQGDTVSSSRERFLEINLDPFRKDLKIVSFYTTKLNEREELRNWWNLMSFEWRTFFGQEIMVYDSLPMTEILYLNADAFVALRPFTVIRNDSFMVVGPDTLSMAFREKLHGHRPDTVIYINDTSIMQLPDTIVADLSPIYANLKNFTQTKEINISYKTHFTNLEPLTQMTELRLIDFSNTPVQDLSPLRNLNKLEAIYFSGTQISDLSPLQYSVNIRELYAFDTPIKDLEVVQYFRQLEKLYCFNTIVSDLSPLANLKSMNALRLSGTNISNLEPLKGLTELQLLDVSNTSVKDISPLAGMKNLQLLNLNHTDVKDIVVLEKLDALTILQLSYTEISSLESLKKLDKLAKIYSDHTRVSDAEARVFMKENPQVLVIYETAALKSWWDDLPIYWRAILAEQSGISDKPGTEELHQIINIKSLNLSQNAYLQQLEPVSRLSMLEQLWLSGTEITDLTPIANLSFLKMLDVSNTRIASLNPLENLNNLEVINVSNSRIESLEPLHGLSDLTTVLADGSRVKEKEVHALKMVQPAINVIYQTESLMVWWGNLPMDWRQIFEQYIAIDVNPKAAQLQAIVDLKEVVINNNSSLQSLLPLSRLYYLEKLSVNAAGISDLSPLADKNFLKTLEITGNPVEDLKPLAGLKQLEEINIESTPVSDLSPLSGLSNLRLLNAGGTQIKSLKPLGQLYKLEELAIFNTRIRKLSPVDQLPALKYLKCYNTRIRSKHIEDLQQQRPELNVLYY